MRSRAVLTLALAFGLLAVPLAVGAQRPPEDDGSAISTPTSVDFPQGSMRPCATAFASSAT
jgi:hypothetical protein